VGDNLVNTVDVSLLGGHYGLTGAAVAPFAVLDVGPTSSGFTDGRPLTDDVIGFEDLVIFALNYGKTTFPRALPAGESNGTSAREEVILARADRVEAGSVVTAELRLKSSGSLAALSTRLSWDAAVVEPVGCAAGEWLAERGGIALAPKPGTVDVALLDAAGSVGEGSHAVVTFRSLAAGDPKIRIESIDGRDAANHAVAIDRSEAAPEIQAPLVTELSAAAPTPFRNSTTLAFGLAQGGPVELAIYSVSGRLVRTLVRETRDAGVHRAVWDGRDDGGSTVGAGVYFARLVVPQGRFTRTLVRLDAR
jgi:hypothetical protein